MNWKDTPRLWAKTRLYDGAPCKVCGNTLRYVKSRNCVQCTHQRVRARAQARARALAVVDGDAALDAALDQIPEEAVPPIDGHLGHSLAYAMIRQAVEDLQSSEQDLVDDAEGWLTSRSNHPFSFDFCCSALGADRDAVEMAILRKEIRSLPEL